MSWVLILTSNYHQRPPAVVGGYPTRVEAEQAGELATVYEKVADSPLGSFLSPDFNRYTVIPGAACSEPLGSTHCETHISYEGAEGCKLTRTVWRWPECPQ